MPRQTSASNEKAGRYGDQAMAVKFFSGFETGDLSEWASGGSGTVSTTSPHSGNYFASAPFVTSPSGLNLATCCVKVSFRIPTGGTPPTSQNVGTLFEFDSTTAAVMSIGFVSNTDGTYALRLLDGTSTAGGSVGSDFAVPAGQWITVEAKRVASTQAIEMRVYGVVQASGTGTKGTATVDKVIVSGSGGGGSLVAGDIDDVVIDDANYPGEAKVIARQAAASQAPTYDTFTKSTGGTIGTVWNDTPFNATTNATKATTGGAQTMNVFSFGAAQTGHGSEVIGASDTILGAKVAVIEKTSATSSGGTLSSIRRRIASVDTDLAITLTTADKYFESAIFVDTLANLNAMQVGVLKGSTTRTHTVEDAWAMVVYVPFLGTAVSASKGAPYEWLLKQPNSRSALYEALGSFAVTQQEVFELLASTRVAKAATYEGLASASASRTSPYVSAAALAQALAVAYEAVSTAFAVSNSKNILYEILAAQVASKITSYVALASSVRQVISAYEALKAASTASTDAYETLASATRSLVDNHEFALARGVAENTAYETTAFVSAPKVENFEGLAAALRVLTFVYAAGAAAVQARTTDYETVKSLTTPSAESYEALAAQVQTRTARYETLGSTTKAQSMGFALVAGLLNAHVTPYEAQAIGGVSRASAIYYEAVNALITLSQSQHEAVASAHRALVKPFEIIANVSGAKSSAYDILADAARSLATAYESLGASRAVSGSAQLWYEARGTVFHALAYHYESVKQLQQTGVAATETLVGVKTPTSSSYESLQGVLHSLASTIEAARAVQRAAEYQFSTLQSRSVATVVRYETLCQLTAQAEKTYEELAALQAVAATGMSWDLLYVLQSVVITAVEVGQAVLVSAIDVIHQVEISNVAAVNALDVSTVDVVPSVSVSGVVTVSAIEVSAVDVVNAVGISDVLAGVE